MTHAAVAARGAAVETNLIEHYASLGTAPGAEMGDEGDLLWVITGAMSATQNGVVGARLAHLEPAALDDRIEEVMRRFRARRVNMNWWVGPTTQPASLSAALEAHGLPKGGAPGPAVDLDTLDTLDALVESHTGPPGLEIVQVLDEAQLWQWIRVHGHDYSEESRREHVELYAALGLAALLGAEVTRKTTSRSCSFLLPARRRPSRRWDCRPA
jgi:hypothetical protein